MFENILAMLRKRPKVDDEQHQQQQQQPKQFKVQSYHEQQIQPMQIDREQIPSEEQLQLITALQQEIVNEEMEVDAAQEYTNLNTATTSSSSTQLKTFELPGLLSSSSKNIEESEMESDENSAFIDDRCVIDRPFNMNERFVTVLDQLDTRVEKLRKEALGLQEKRDFLLMSIDLIKHNEVLHGMQDYEREEISCYIQRVSSRLSTIELNVKTVRDGDQEESLSQVNTMIDSLITSNDPVMSRQRCQTFLNACSGSDLNQDNNYVEDISNSPQSCGATASTSSNPLFHDKKFESALLGCTLDDQKNIKKRLLALMDYLNRQTVSD